MNLRKGMNRIGKAVRNPWKLLSCTEWRLERLGAFRNWPDERFLKMKYRVRTGKKLRLNPPVTFNEKLQWLKLHDRQDIMTRLVDKYEVRKFIEELHPSKNVMGGGGTFI